MSVQETPRASTSPGPLKPEIPQKPSPRTVPSPPGGDGGKVKMIVKKFSKTDLREAPGQRPAANGAAEASQIKRSGRPPTVKPKPRLPLGGATAPPLPAKRRRTGQRQAKEEGGDEGDGNQVEGGRSAPDGKEVEVRLVGGGEAEAEHTHTPLSPCCDPGCSCVCHLQQPGMILIWVPVDTNGGEEEQEEEEEEEEEQEEQEEEEEEEGGDEGEPCAIEISVEDEELSKEDGEVTAGGGEDSKPEYELVDQREEWKQKKEKFHQALDVVIGDGARRLSDPGPRAILAALNAGRSQSPPVPPKRNRSAQVHRRPTQNNEEKFNQDNIYEATLPAAYPAASKTATAGKEQDVPLIRPCQSGAEVAPSAGDVPPAVPPRMPIMHTTPMVAMMPVHRGVLLPQPTPEERRNLRPLSSSSSSTSGPGPQTTPPPLLPKTDPGRLSSVSMQALTRIKEGEANEGDKTDGGVEPRPVRSGSLRKMTSFSWESRLQDEPLYQTYRASVITKEIRRQTVCRNVSKTSVDYAMDRAPRRSGAENAASAAAGGSPKGVATAAPSQCTLWQDQPQVLESGVLEKLTPEQCKYQESMFEVLTSEASYLRSLRVLIEHFMNSRELEETMIIRDRKTLFSNILRIREVSERFLKDLDQHISQEVVFQDICDIIHYHAQHNFPAYIDYVRNQIYQDKTYSSLLKNNPSFATVIARLQESPQCQRLPFMSFLLLPFQRITRIKMLLENILRRTKEKTAEEETASKALTSVSKIIDECNTQVGKMRQMEELYHVSQTLEFDKLKAVPLISQTRYLEKKGELQEMSKGGTIFNMRPKFNPVYLFLFNDLLIIAAKKGTERFVVLDYAHRSLVQVLSAVESGVAAVGSLEHCFNLTLLENHQGRMMERLLRAPSQSDMHRWMAAFPNPTNPDQHEEEVIYEDWDCPQVQCVEQYVAQQADELALEPTDIVNVTRKTEGCYEGIRLSDGQKGWFPAANVMEITNEHVRRRNLRERYRVMQAASVVASNKANTSH
ncbi:rho guanine nucleotide exchange factor 15 [Pungitius pungitius]|uniref:rho guanine nucleotide exchange factor 15 n=1 Tax=Pungitius pungitius TaxID=134920 RepID=UPI002E139CAD